MKRRQFLNRSFAAAAAAAAGFGGSPSLMAKTKAVPQEYYELRTYEIPSSAMQKLMKQFLANGLVPALGRQGIDRIGVFTQIPEDGNELELFNRHADSLSQPRRLRRSPIVACRR